MSTPTKAAAHTPGAERAARAIASGSMMAYQDWMTEIIDRETAAPEMLEALEEFMLTYAECVPFPNAEKAVMLAKAAIQKARGGQ